MQGFYVDLGASAPEAGATDCWVRYQPDLGLMMGCHPHSFPSSNLPIVPRTALHLGPGLLPSLAGLLVWERWELGQPPHVKRPFPYLVWPQLGSELGTEVGWLSLVTQLEQGQRLVAVSRGVWMAEKRVMSPSLHLEEKAHSITKCFSVRT